MVQVYRNRNKDCWSIRDKQSGRVVGHATVVTLENVRFAVGERSRQRAIRMRKRNVNGWVEGDLLATGNLGPCPPDGLVQVSYRPFVRGHFIRLDDGQPIVAAPWAVLCEGKVFVPSTEVQTSANEAGPEHRGWSVADAAPLVNGSEEGQRC